MIRSNGKYLASVIVFFTLGCVIITAQQHSQSKIEIKLIRNVETVVEASGIDESALRKLRDSNLPQSALTKIFPVTVGALPGSGEVTPMLGDYTITNDSIRFKPRFPFDPSQQYSATFDLKTFAQLCGEELYEGRDDLIRLVFSLPKSADSVATTITNVYPSGDRLPANQLRLYIHFSGPMSFGEAYQHIHLFDESGKQIERAFLIFDQELWDATRERFTLLFDPGRIKRGLRSNGDLGLALIPGRKYRLVIDKEWRDGAGQPLGSSFEKTFVAEQPDRNKVDPEKWDVEAPPESTRVPLRLIFPRPLDHALLESAISIFDPEGKPVSGRRELCPGETEFRFTPTDSWKGGKYTIRIDTALEDLAGNNLRGPFDVDLSQQDELRPDQKYAIIMFSTLPKQ